MFGFDVGNIDKPDGLNVDKLYKDDINRWIRKAYSMGGIITVTMHEDNPLTGGSAWDNKNGTVRAILPPQSNSDVPNMHKEYMQTLSKIADFFEDLAPIPILFRPYHENNNVWSWWGSSACTPEEFVAVWRMTVDFFLQRDTCKHNLLFTISPQDPATLDEYFARYPGDNYVDVFGFDGYQLWEASKASVLGHMLSEVMNHSLSLANRSGAKPVVLSEVGSMYKYNTSSGYGPAKWWTTVLGAALEITGYRVAYALVWRNTYGDADCFAPAIVPAVLTDGDGGDWPDDIGEDADICELQDFRKFIQLSKVVMLPAPPLTNQTSSISISGFALQGRYALDVESMASPLCCMVA